MVLPGTSAAAVTHEDSTVSLRLPPFRSQDPELWFAQVERQFDARYITAQSSRFGHAVSALPVEIVAEIRDLILSPPAQAPYDTLKRELLDRTALSIHRRLQQLLGAEELGAQKPSQLLRRMRQLTGSTPLDPAIMQQLFLQRLPSDIRVVLTAADKMSLDDLAHLADRILDLRTQSSSASHPLCASRAAPFLHPSQPAALSIPESAVQLVATDLTTTVNSPQCGVNRLTELVTGLTTLVVHATASRHRSPSRFRYVAVNPALAITRHVDTARRHQHKFLTSTTSAPLPAQVPFCWYHRTFGAHARQCQPPCSWEGNVPPST
ncbi:uncharacterized protein LOC135398405 [Ornithodoros turicata]|uniref:uncharacterized protein LOC135398405 n=1 Tax=Ornithodoros turicata TaxID=34597 RepID=UPI0031395D5E